LRLVRRSGACQGARSASGWRSKVTATDGPPDSAALAITVSSTRLWPRCTPSKVPTVATGGPPADRTSGEESLATRFTTASPVTQEAG